MPGPIKLHVGKHYKAPGDPVYGSPSLWSSLRLHVDVRWFNLEGAQPAECAAERISSEFVPAIVDTGADLTVIPVDVYSSLVEILKDRYFTAIHAFAKSLSAHSGGKWANTLVKDLRQAYEPSQGPVTDSKLETIAQDSVRGLSGVSDATLNTLRRKATSVLKHFRLPTIEMRRLLPDQSFQVNTAGGIVEVAKFLVRAELRDCQGPNSEKPGHTVFCDQLIEAAVMDPQGRTERELNRTRPPNALITLQKPYALLGMDVINQMKNFRYSYKDGLAQFHHETLSGE